MAGLFLIIFIFLCYLIGFIALNKQERKYTSRPPAPKPTPGNTPGNMSLAERMHARYGHLAALSKLNHQQRTAVYTDAENALVIAGAGCGKSTTILGRVQYLTASGKASAKEILLLSFTKDTARDLNDTLSRYEMPQIAQTFHKLGKAILEKSAGRKFAVLEPNKTQELINAFLCQDDADLRNMIYSWVAYYKDSVLSYEEFGNNGNYAAYLDGLSFEGIKSALEKKTRGINKGERFKSLPEVLIANWLFENGVKYEYERPYKDINGNTVCKPDFYLPDYDVWIEHWGVMENDTVPWLKDSRKARKYVADKQKKQRQYMQDGARVINLHLYEFYTKTLSSNLKSQLEQYGVVFEPLTPDQRDKVVKELLNQRKYSGLAKMLERFLTLFKSNGYATLDDLDKLERQTKANLRVFDHQRADLFFALFRRFYAFYNDYLKQSGMIDFSDMIHRATNVIMSGAYQSKYKYILIDEFQDISKDRCDLILALQRQTGAKCFCVGDDWQSIYRFNGGDLDYFVNFGRWFRSPVEFRIEETFRSGQNLVDLASEFVQRNPYQKRKTLKSRAAYDTKIKAFICPTEGCHSDGMTALVQDIVAQFGADAKVLLLVRNWSDLDIFNKEEMQASWKLSGEGSGAVLKHKVYKGLEFNISTVHGSKGLQANIVLILNMQSGLSGFPNQTIDDKLFSELLVKLDSYPYAEERRLFYVALTRAIKMCYLVVPAYNASEFWTEISRSKNIEQVFTGCAMKKCPRCPGYLILRGNGKYGCSNYAPGKYNSCGYMEDVQKPGEVPNNAECEFAEYIL